MGRFVLIKIAQKIFLLFGIDEDTTACFGV